MRSACSRIVFQLQAGAAERREGDRVALARGPGRAGARARRGRRPGSRGRRGGRGAWRLLAEWSRDYRRADVVVPSRPWPRSRPFAPSCTASATPTSPRVLAPPYDVIPRRLPGRALRARPAEHRARHPEPDARRCGVRGGRGDLPPLARRTASCEQAAVRRPSTCSSRRFDDRTAARSGASAFSRASAPRTRSGGIILPHEHTRAAAKEDRWRVLQATRANFSPIFLMFPRPRGPVPRPRPRGPGGDAAASRVHRRRGRRPPPVASGRARARSIGFQSLLGGVKAYIADGHHRHATALRYRDAAGPDGRLDARLLHAHGRAGPRRPALPPHPLRGPLARGGDGAPARALPPDSQPRTPPVAAAAVGRLARPPTPSPSPSPATGALVAEAAARHGSAAAGADAAQPARARHLLPPPRRPRPAPRREGRRR